MEFCLPETKSFLQAGLTPASSSCGFLPQKHFLEIPFSSALCPPCVLVSLESCSFRLWHGSQVVIIFLLVASARACLLHDPILGRVNAQSICDEWKSKQSISLVHSQGLSPRDSPHPTLAPPQGWHLGRKPKISSYSEIACCASKAFADLKGFSELEIKASI